MNNYKELIEALDCGEYIVFKAGNAKVRQVTKYNNKIADAIEQLVKERDAAVKELGEFIEEAQSRLGEWRGVQE